MAKLLFGDRIGQQGAVLLACSAVVFDAKRRILLTRRIDNGRWCLPGGHFEAGEDVTEATIREVKEETGLEVELLRLTGVYSSPHRLLEYSDGTRFHVVALNFEARVIGGVLTTSEETSEFTWCPHDQLGTLDIMEHHVERIGDAVSRVEAVFIK